MTTVGHLGLRQPQPRAAHAITASASFITLYRPIVRSILRHRGQVSAVRNQCTCANDLLRETASFSHEARILSSRLTRSPDPPAAGVTAGSSGRGSARDPISRWLMLPQADSDAPALGGKSQLLFTCQPADARERQRIRQVRSLFQLAECYLAMLIQISPDGARRAIDLCLHLLPRFEPRLACSGLPSSLEQFPQLWPGLLQPVRHAHLAIHRRCGDEVFSGLLVLARATVELTETMVTVGDAGPHENPARQDSSSSITFASRKSAVAKPSVNRS